jgi:hypothetical protein
MNVPKRLYPHLYEYELLMAEGRELAANMYATKNEREFEYECTEIYKTKLYRNKNLGTDKQIHCNEKEI